MITVWTGTLPATVKFPSTGLHPQSPYSNFLLDSYHHNVVGTKGFNVRYQNDLEDKEFTRSIKRHARRQKVFMEEGLTEDQAFDLAELMYTRDTDPQEDRRICFECEHYKNKMCSKIKDKFQKPTQQLRFTLQRCDYFELIKPFTEDELHQINASNQHQERE